MELRKRLGDAHTFFRVRPVLATLTAGAATFGAVAMTQTLDAECIKKMYTLSLTLLSTAMFYSEMMHCAANYARIALDVERRTLQIAARDKQSLPYISEWARRHGKKTELIEALDNIRYWNAYESGR